MSRASDTYDDLLTTLCNGLSHHHLYSAQHPRVIDSSRKFSRSLSDPATEADLPALVVRLHDGQFVDEGRVLIGATIRGRRLIELVRSLGGGGLLFKRGVTADELLALFELARSLDGRPVEVGEARTRLEGLGITNILVVPTDESLVWYEEVDSALLRQEVNSWRTAADNMAAGSPELMASIPLYQSMMDTVENSLSSATSGEAVDVNEARTVSEELHLATLDGFQDMLQLALYPDYDAYTVGHSIRVALYGVCVCKGLGAPPELLVEIGAAGLLHDVGKSQVPYEVLYKPGRLDDDERRVVSRHPYDGAQILLESEDATRLAVGAAWGHHLRHDGGGYPARSEWARSSHLTSLLQVCDVFEALTARRPYKPPFSPRRAYEIMLADRNAFDPWALGTFVRAIGIYPPGSCVLLSDDSYARVLSASEQLDRPVVRPMNGGKPTDLSNPQESALSVVRILTEDEVAAGVHKAPVQEHQADPREGQGEEQEVEEFDLPEWPMC